MILIFDKNGKYFSEASSLRDAGDKTGCQTGNISQILTGAQGHVSSHGYFFVKHSCNTEESLKKRIESCEKALSLIVTLSETKSLKDKIDKILIFNQQ